jgi:RNA polymerase sigma factor FliA
VTPAEEQELWRRFKETGDPSAREALAVEYMRAVKYVAGRMAIHIPSSVEMDDLIGWGALGLMDAIEKFDPGQKIKFSTYATIRIRGAILDEIRSLDWAPRSIRALARKIGSAREQLRHEGGADPRTDELAEAVGVTVEQVEECLAQVQTAHVLSLDSYLPSEDREEARKLDLLADAQASTPEDDAALIERRDTLVEAILGLAEQQQKVLHLYYYEELTLKEIGAVLEVSESRVCQIHGAAIQKLRKVVRGEDLPSS